MNVMKLGYGLVVLALAILFLGWPGVPFHGAVLAHPIQTLCVVGLTMVGVCFRAHLGRCLDGIYEMPRWVFNVGIFAVALLIYAAVAWFVFGGIPRIDDGVASLFQARLFAVGKCTQPLPADPDFFQVFAVLGAREGLAHRCGMYPPGWPLLLTPGVWLGVPWLVNPLLGSLLLVVMAELGRSLYDDRTGRVAALLALPSPFLLVLSGVHLSNMATILFLGLAVLSLRKLWKTYRWIWGGVAGLCWGMALLCRPVDAAVLGAICALGFLFPAKRLWRCRLGMVAGLVVALLAIGVLLGFQQITTGDWQTPGHELGMGSYGKFGFVQLTPRKFHTPEAGLKFTMMRLRALNECLLGWPIPSLLVVLLPFVWGRARLREFLLLLPMIGLLGVYAFFWYYEACLPARYISAAAPYLFILSARGLQDLHEVASRRRALSGIPAFIVISGVLFLAVGLPFHFQAYGDDYYDVEEVLPRVVRDYGITNALVFMDSMGVDDRKMDDTNDYYATGFLRNDLELTNDVLFVRNLKERNVELVRHHPDRAAYLYRYQRRQEQAILYRMVLEEGELNLIPVRPKTRDVVEAPE